MIFALAEANTLERHVKRHGYKNLPYGHLEIRKFKMLKNCPYGPDFHSHQNYSLEFHMDIYEIYN